MTPGTPYTVIASPEAEDSLLLLWLNYPSDRTAITRASQRIDSALRYHPSQQGSLSPTPDEPDRRAIDRIPVRAYYRVSEPDLLVTIVGYVLVVKP
jgi:hypothetical protein